MDENPNKKRNDNAVNDYLEQLNKCKKFDEIQNPEKVLNKNESADLY